VLTVTREKNLWGAAAGCGIMESVMIRPKETLIAFGGTALLLGAVTFLRGLASERSHKNKPRAGHRSTQAEESRMTYPVTKTEEEWRAILTPEQCRTTRKKGTEPAFSGKYYGFKGEGFYKCVGCGNVLFSSEDKYDSGTEWLSFWAPASVS